MTSPARQHRERILAEAAAIQVAADGGKRSGAAATEYELQRARLGVDLRRLHDIQSIERKIELKRELLPAYQPWVEGVLAADSGAPDDILTHAMIWSIDVGAFHEALPLAAYVIRHDLPLPERFDRTAPTLIAEEIAETALKWLGEPDKLGPEQVAGIVDELAQVAELVADQDIFDQVRAKLEKAQGIAAQLQAEAIAPDADGPAGARRAALERAQSHLTRALALDGSSGVKKRIEAVTRAIRDAAEQPS